VEVIARGALGEEQLATLRAAAETCRISRALSVPVALTVTVGS